MTLPRVVLGAALLVLAACSTPRCEHDMAAHVFAFDAEGRAVQPLDREVRLHDDGRNGRGSLREYVDNLLRRADQQCSAFCPAPRDHAHVPERRILVHVHGGLKSPEASLAQADAILSDLDAEESAQAHSWHHAIFIHWPSDALSTYGDHLFYQRRGRRADVLGPITSPFVFANDMATGLVRAPVTLLYQYGLDAALGAKVGFDQTLPPSWQTAEAAYAAQHDAPADERYDLAVGDYARGALTQARRFLLYWPTQLTKIPLQTIVLDGMGRGAWNAMLWRTRALFWQHEAFNQSGEPQALRDAARAEPNGHLAVVLRMLRDHVREQKRLAAAAGHPVDYKITLVGHSMGAIVINEALSSSSWDEPLLDGEDVEQIVYMAPACSIQEAADSVVPFMQANEHVSFHLLTLHPLAEADEINAYDLVPRGSLLEWIDNWYSQPASHTERRLGKWTNAVPALALFRDVRERFSIKAFSVQPGHIPQKHGQFNDIPFWRADCWSTDGRSSYPADWRTRDSAGDHASPGGCF